MSFSLQVVDAERYSKANNEDLLGGKSPQLVWFGNGEVKPVRIQFYFEQNPVGDPIEVDHLGNINENQ